MKSSKRSRPYAMGARAEAAARTREAILDGALVLLRQASFDEVTLDAVAGRAGVTVQTVIRRFGSKEGLFEALTDRESARVLAEREPPEGGTLADAVRALVDHYEADGAMVLRFLAQEERFPFLAEVVATGRRVHESWVAEHCGQALGSVRGAARRRRLDAAIAATDLYTWKLLRLDRGRSRAEVEQTMLTLLEGLVRARRRT